MENLGRWYEEPRSTKNNYSNPSPAYIISNSTLPNLLAQYSVSVHLVCTKALATSTQLEGRSSQGSRVYTPGSRKQSRRGSQPQRVEPQAYLSEDFKAKSLEEKLEDITTKYAKLIEQWQVALRMRCLELTKCTQNRMSPRRGSSLPPELPSRTDEVSSANDIDQFEDYEHNERKDGQENDSNNVILASDLPEKQTPSKTWCNLGAQREESKRTWS